MYGLATYAAVFAFYRYAPATIKTFEFYALSLFFFFCPRLYIFRFECPIIDSTLHARLVRCLLVFLFFFSPPALCTLYTRSDSGRTVERRFLEKLWDVFYFIFLFPANFLAKKLCVHTVFLGRQRYGRPPRRRLFSASTPHGRIVREKRTVTVKIIAGKRRGSRTTTKVWCAQAKNLLRSKTVLNDKIFL